MDLNIDIKNRKGFKVMLWFGFPEISIWDKDLCAGIWKMIPETRGGSGKLDGLDSPLKMLTVDGVTPWAIRGHSYWEASAIM